MIDAPEVVPAPKSKVALTVNDFCTTYSVGRTFAYLEIAAGRLRTRKAGRRTLILAQDAEAWLASLPSGGAA